MFEIAVCDDCAMDRECLIRYIMKKADQYELQIHEFSSGLELLDAMEEIRFSAIFLDVDMKGMDGNKTSRKIRSLDANLVLVFYTGFAEPTPKTMEVQPYRYIMKNMSADEILKYVEESLVRVNEIDDAPKLVATLNYRQIIIDSKHVVYIDKYKRNSRIHLSESTYKFYNIKAEEGGEYPVICSREALVDIYNKLKKNGFGFPHASYIINFNYLRACTNKNFELAGFPDEFPIARSKLKRFIEMKERFIRAKYVNGR